MYRHNEVQHNQEGCILERCSNVEAKYSPQVLWKTIEQRDANGKLFSMAIAGVLSAPIFHVDACVHVTAYH